MLALMLSTLPMGAAEPLPLRLTMKEALKQALDQNPQVHQSILTLAQSQEDSRAAKAALLPSVGAFAFLQRNKANFDTLLGVPTPGGPDVVGPYDWGQIGLEAQVTVFDLSLWQRWKAAEHGQSAAQAQTRGVREGITALTVGQYLRALRNADSVKASQSRVDLAEALEKLAEDQQTHGIGTKLDTLRAKVQLQNERQRLIQAETQLRTSLYGLAKILDLEPGTPIELMDHLGAPEFPTFSFQDAYQKGLGSRPELAALDAQQKAAESLQSAAQSVRLPSVTLTGSYSSTGLYPSQVWTPVFQVTLGVKVPLFTGGLVDSRISKAKAELAKVKEARREVESQVSLDVQVAQAELDSARSEVAVATQTVDLANEALLQARHRFEAGVSNNIEVINAQDELARANDNQISALYRLNQSQADLAKAMGQMEAFFNN
jgi:outer membrane protein TolC